MRHKIDVGIGGSLEDIRRRAIDAVARADAGEPVHETYLSFENLETLMKIVTTKRFEILQHVHRHPEASIASLARSLKRDYKRVHQDVEALVEAGLIERTAEGLRADYSEIRATITL